MKFKLFIVIILFFSSCTNEGSNPVDPNIIQGCIDYTACNYNPDANQDDSSCEYPVNENVDCDGNCNMTADDDECGCLDEKACNYNEDANLNDESCFYGLDEILSGCQLPSNSLYLSDENFVLYKTNQDIGGIQFSVEGAIVSDVSGGDAELAGFNLSTGGDNIVLGYSLTGIGIPSGCGDLIQITLEGEALVLSDIIISDLTGQEIDFSYFGGCDGACGSTLEFDECGVCGGSGQDPDGNGICEDYDCQGVPNGTAQISECLGCVDSPYYNYNCDDIAVLEQFIANEEIFSGLEPYQIGNQSWNEDGRIWFLDLSAQGLSVVPDQIGNLSYLTHLVLTNNDFISLPESIAHLVNLESLYLQYNEIISLPNTIGNMKQLQYLDLTENELTSLPKSIGQLDNLLELHLHGNYLATLPDEIGDLASLNRLVLSSVQLTTIPASIGNLTNLQYLFINDNQLALSTLPDEICDLSSLIELKMNNNIIFALPDNIGDLQSLRILNAHWNFLTNVPSSLCDLHPSCEVSIHHNYICNVSDCSHVNSDTGGPNVNWSPQLNPVSGLPCLSEPEITGYKGTSTISQNETLILSIADFEITDVDAVLIDDTTFTLHIENGNDYTVTGSTITPALDYIGNIIVSVYVTENGEEDGLGNPMPSESFSISISVIKK